MIRILHRLRMVREILMMDKTEFLDLISICPHALEQYEKQERHRIYMRP